MNDGDKIQQNMLIGIPNVIFELTQTYSTRIMTKLTQQLTPLGTPIYCIIQQI